MEARLVIADMSMHNANAFYELAVRHMVGLPTIHIIHKDWKIPFDVAPYRAIHFSREEFSDIEIARSESESVVREVIQPDFVVENPITHARARIELNKHATPEMQALAAEVASLRKTISDVQNEIAATRVVPSLQHLVLRASDLIAGSPSIGSPSIGVASAEPVASVYPTEPVKYVSVTLPSNDKPR
jgi:hypothetical protein